MATHHNIGLAALLLGLLSCTPPSAPSVPAVQNTPVASLAPPATPIQSTVLPSPSTLLPVVVPIPNATPKPTPQASPLPLAAPTSAIIKGQHFTDEMLQLLGQKPLTLEAFWENDLTHSSKEFDVFYNKPFELKDLPLGVPIRISLKDSDLNVKLGNVIETVGFESQFITLKADNTKYEFKVESKRTVEFDCECDLSQKTTFWGKMFDEGNLPLDGVKVTAKSLNQTVNFQAETTSTGGAYAFNNAPAGIPIEIIATKSGFTSRKRVEVLFKNKGDPAFNRFDFGTDGSRYGTGSIDNALSDQPEVIRAGTHAGNTVTLTFNEPMNRQSVLDNFSIRAFNTVNLGVENSTDSPIFKGDSKLSTLSNPLLYDASDFDTIWNSDDTEVTFSLKNGQYFPTDRSNYGLQFQVVFNNKDANRSLIDKSGVARKSKHFKLTEGPREESFVFSLRPDEIQPALAKIEAQTLERQSTHGDAIKVIFSEPMMRYTRLVPIMGGMAARSNVPGAMQFAPAGIPDLGLESSRQAAENYTVSIQRPGVGAIHSGTWASLGGTAQFDPLDKTFKTVLLALLDKNANLFAPGDTIQVTMTNPVMDPAGNRIDAAKNSLFVLVP